MTIVATRQISQPDRHSFYNAYPLQSQAQTAVDILQGVTLVIGTVTLAAPSAAQIYREFRINRNRAAALRIYTRDMRGATAADLEDFIYLLDDTLSVGGAPGMAPGQEWTITFQTVGSAPHESLLSRLRDRQASYGNYAHHLAITGNATTPGEGAIRVVYDLTTRVSVRSQQNTLALLLRGFFESVPPARRAAARTSADYQQLFSDGYVSLTNVRHGDGDHFYALLATLEYVQLSGAAHTAVQRITPPIPASRRSSAVSGATEFMVSQATMATLYDNIRGLGLGTHALRAHLQQGFQNFDAPAKNRARDEARRWRTRALGAVSGATRLNTIVQGHLNNNIQACLGIYLTALYNPAQLPQNMHALYYSYLHTNPADIWGGYTAILVPTGRQMAHRLSHIILASWDPSGTDRPPGLARAIGQTLRTLMGRQ